MVGWTGGGLENGESREHGEMEERRIRRRLMQRDGVMEELRVEV